jgi:pimeloyl-ACP methyl ester carboxylesterase
VKTATGIAFDDVGDGDLALLLLPGWGAPRTVYRSLLPRLAPHVRAIAIDWRGHGGSTPATRDFGYAELLADATSVIEAAGVSRVIPVGLSHGGWAALDVRGALGPARVPAIGLIDWMVLGAPPPFFDALAGLQSDQWAAVRERLFAMWTTGVTAPAVHAYIEEMRRADGPMWQRAAREIASRFAAEARPLAVIERAPCPTVHIYAQPADPGYLTAQQTYAADHPWFAAHRVSASSHFPMLEAPDEVATHLTELVSRAMGR